MYAMTSRTPVGFAHQALPLLTRVKVDAVHNGGRVDTPDRHGRRCKLSRPGRDGAPDHNPDEAVISEVLSVRAEASGRLYARRATYFGGPEEFASR